MADLTVTDIETFLGTTVPGLTQPMVDAALQAVRGYCRWTIAPVTTETLTLDVLGDYVRLPSLHVLDVASVSDHNGVPVTDVTWSEMGMVRAPVIDGFRTCTVTFTHGWTFDEVPALVAVVAGVARRLTAAASADPTGIQSKQIGTFRYSRFEDAAAADGIAGLTEMERVAADQWRIQSIT